MINKILFVIAWVWIAILVASAFHISHWYEAVDYDLVREWFQTLNQTTDIKSMIKECWVSQVYRHWDTKLVVAIQQNCWKTILVDVLSDYPTYQRMNSSEITFYSMS